MEYISQTEMIDLLHERQFEMLCWLNNICEKNQIHMYMWGGTLIGAVRHHDLIPWDDDIDIVMFEDEYNKLRKCIKQYDNNIYELIEYDNDTYFCDFIPRIIYKNSSIHDENLSHINNIWLDIFLLNKTSNNKTMRSLHCLQLKTIHGFALGHRKDNRFSNRFKTNYISYICAKFLQIIGKLIPLNTIYNLHNCYSHKYNSKNTKYVICTNNAPTCLCEKHSHPIDVYKKTIYVDFRTTKLPIPSGYDIILKSGYGDYMKLPPIEKRVFEHRFFSDMTIDNKKMVPLA